MGSSLILRVVNYRNAIQIIHRYFAHFILLERVFTTSTRCKNILLSSILETMGINVIIAWGLWTILFA